MLPFTIAHYKKMFKDPVIVIHDNNSNDDTVDIAKKEGAVVISFTTNGMNDTIQSQIKSEAAMNASADWVLCIDADEECFITENDLEELDKRGINIVQFDGWNIFDQVSSPWDIKIPMGCRSSGYSKPVLLRTKIFNNIEFAAGAHDVTLTPNHKAVWSKNEYKLLHYKHWSCEWNINRSAELGSRQSSDNKAKGHSFHFSFSKNVHEDYFQQNYNQREIIFK
jgi:glycosyltransferase involved in cell wall biosynthesis